MPSNQAGISTEEQYGRRKWVSTWKDFAKRIDEELLTTYVADLSDWCTF